MVQLLVERGADLTVTAVMLARLDDTLQMDSGVGRANQNLLLMRRRRRRGGGGGDGRRGAQAAGGSSVAPQ